MVGLAMHEGSHGKSPYMLYNLRSNNWISHCLKGALGPPLTKTQAWGQYNEPVITSSNKSSMPHELKNTAVNLHPLHN